MKLCVLGGAGVRCIFLAKSIASNAIIGDITEVVYFDIDNFKLSKYGKLAKYITGRINPNIKVTLTNDPQEAISDADYVITTIRVGGDMGRVKDEEVSAKYGLLAQETTGVGGLAMAIRSIPILIKYCEMIQQYAKKDCLIFNFTNPSGIVTQALNTLGYPVIGVCDAPSEFIKQLAHMLQVDEERLSYNCFGLNHLSWFSDFKLDGEDITEQLYQNPDLYVKTEIRLFKKSLIELLKPYLPNEYLYFYYNRFQAIANNRQAKISRAKLIWEINQQMNIALQAVDVDKDPLKAFQLFFDDYYIRENNYMVNESGGIKRPITYITPSLQDFLDQPDPGGYAGVALRYIKGLKSKEPIEMILSVKNGDCIDGLAIDDIIEVSCVIDSNGCVAKKPKQMPVAVHNLILTMKQYERLVVEAVLTKSKDKAIQALLVNPLIGDYEIARKVVEDVLAANGIQQWT